MAYAAPYVQERILSNVLEPIGRHDVVELMVRFVNGEDDVYTRIDKNEEWVALDDLLGPEEGES